MTNETILTHLMSPLELVLVRLKCTQYALLNEEKLLQIYQFYEGRKYTGILGRREIV